MGSRSGPPVANAAGYLQWKNKPQKTHRALHIYSSLKYTSPFVPLNPLRFIYLDFLDLQHTSRCSVVVWGGLNTRAPGDCYLGESDKTVVRKCPAPRSSHFSSRFPRFSFCLWNARHHIPLVLPLLSIKRDDDELIIARRWGLQQQQHISGAHPSHPRAGLPDKPLGWMATNKMLLATYQQMMIVCWIYKTRGELEQKREINSALFAHSPCCFFSIRAGPPVFFV